MTNFIVSTNIAPSGTLESLHRASVESMLNDDHQFRCWIQKEVEDTQTQFLRLFRPLFDTRVFEEVKHQTTRDLGITFKGAFEARARFIPPEGSRYKLLQFKAGEKFDPAYMKIEETNSKATSAISYGSIHRIKACVHGCLIEYPINKDSSFADIPQSLDQPLIPGEGGLSGRETGILKSDKAVVILGN